MSTANTGVTYDHLRSGIDALEGQHQALHRKHADALRTVGKLRTALDECRALVPPDPPGPPPIVKPPVKPPTVPGTPWPHAMARMSVEEAAIAAEARVRPMLDAAPARADRGYDIMYPQLEDAGRNGFIAGEGRHGRWGKAYGSPRHYSAPGVLIPRRVGLTMDNCEMLAAWDDQSSGAKWHVRMSNVPSVMVTRMQCVGHDLKGRNYPKEHGLYVDVSGDVTVADSLFRNIGGHPLYFPNRAYDYEQYGPVSLPFSEPPTFTFDNVIGIHCEQDASRSAYDITLYDPGSYENPGTVIIKDVAMIQAWPFQRPQGTNERHPIEPYRHGETRASGGVVITNYNPAHVGRPGKWPTERVVVTRAYFHTVQARHSLLSIHNVEDILLKDATFRAEGQGANKIIPIGRKELRGAGVMAAPKTFAMQNLIAPGMLVEIEDDDSRLHRFDMNCPGQRVTWTPGSGFNTTDL